MLRRDPLVFFTWIQQQETDCFDQNEDDVQRQQSHLSKNNEDVIIEQREIPSPNNQVQYSSPGEEHFDLVCTAKHATKRAQLLKKTSEDQREEYFYVLDTAVDSKKISVSSRPSFPLICTQDHNEHENQQDARVDWIPIQTIDVTSHKKNCCQKGAIILLALLLIVTVTQVILAWYGAYYTKCKKRTDESASLAPLFMFGVSIAEMVFSSCIAVITLRQTQKCRKKRYEFVLVKLVKTCLIILFAVYILLAGYIGIIIGEYRGCEFKRVLSKIQAVLTLLQCTLFIVLGQI